MPATRLFCSHFVGVTILDLAAGAPARFRRRNSSERSKA